MASEAAPQPPPPGSSGEASVTNDAPMSTPWAPSAPPLPTPADTIAGKAGAVAVDPIASIGDPNTVTTVLSFLSTPELLGAAQVSKLWRASADADPLWRAACARDWCADVSGVPRKPPAAPSTSTPDEDTRVGAGAGAGAGASDAAGGAASAADAATAAAAAAAEAASAASEPATFDSFRACWLAYHDDVGQYFGYYPRAVRMWQKMMDFFMANCPRIAATIEPGATEEDLNDVEAAQGATMPAAMRAIYRVHNGQTGAYDRSRITATALFNGLLGGVLYYGSVRNQPIFPVQSVSATPGMPGAGSHRESRFVVSRGVTEGCSAITVGYPSCDVLVSGVHAVPDPTHDAAVAVDVDDCDPHARWGVNDGFLRWLEEHARRLSTGVYAMQVVPRDITRALTAQVPLGDGTMDIQYLCTVHEKPPLQVSATTNGVLIEASPVFIAQRPQRQGVMWTYRIRARLLGDAPLASCQLRSRHWRIQMEGAEEENVRGDGVIGEYPVLNRGGEPFSYHSCTHGRFGTAGAEVMPRGVMGGSFTMVPGTLAEPTGEPFEAIVPTFTLEVPEFLY